MLTVVPVSGLPEVPQVTWRWEPETDILSGSWRSPWGGEAAETVEISSPEGAVLVLDVVDGEIAGLDVVIWPDVETVAALEAPAPDASGRVLVPAAPPESHQIDTDLAVTVDGLEQTFHLQIGGRRPVSAMRLADRLMVELDAGDRLAGFWLTGVPPFPGEE
jgi:hypothetical protein